MSRGYGYWFDWALANLGYDRLAAHEFAEAKVAAELDAADELEGQLRLDAERDRPAERR